MLEVEPIFSLLRVPIHWCLLAIFLVDGGAKRGIIESVVIYMQDFGRNDYPSQ